MENIVVLTGAGISAESGISTFRDANGLGEGHDIIEVATKAYAMTCLQLLGTEFDWIQPELKNCIKKQYHEQSAAFKARSRMVLKKLNENTIA